MGHLDQIFQVEGSSPHPARADTLVSLPHAGAGASVPDKSGEWEPNPKLPGVM